MWFCSSAALLKLLFSMILAKILACTSFRNTKTAWSTSFMAARALKVRKCQNQSVLPSIFLKKVFFNTYLILILQGVSHWNEQSKLVLTDGQIEIFNLIPSVADTGSISNYCMTQEIFTPTPADCCPSISLKQCFGQ